MNLVATLFGIVNPLFAVPITIYDYTRRRKPFFCAVILAAAMAYVAYFYQSRYIGDLERYMNLLVLYKDIPFLECFDRFYSGLYALDAFFWVCARFADARMLVVITAFILYFIAFYVSLDYLSDLENMSSYHIVGVIVFIFSLLPYYSYLSSIRSSLALSFGTIAIYREYVKGKKSFGSYLLYILPILFHLAGALVILLRFALMLTGKKRYFIWAIGGVLLALMGSGIFNSARYLGGIFSELSDKMVEYSAYGGMMNSAWFVAVRSSIVTYLQKVFCAIVLGVLIWNSRELNDRTDSDVRINKMSQIGVCLSFIILGMLFFPTTFYLRFFAGLFPIILLSAYRNDDTNVLKKILLWGAAAGMFVIQLHTLVDNTNVSVFVKHLALGIMNLITY